MPDDFDDEVNDGADIPHSKAAYDYIQVNTDVQTNIKPESKSSRTGGPSTERKGKHNTNIDRLASLECSPYYSIP